MRQPRTPPASLHHSQHRRQFASEPPKQQQQQQQQQQQEVRRHVETVTAGQPAHARQDQREPDERRHSDAVLIADQSSSPSAGNYRRVAGVGRRLRLFDDCQLSMAIRVSRYRLCFYSSALVVLLIILYAASSRHHRSTSTRADDNRVDIPSAQQSPRVSLDVYMESLCSDTEQFFDEQLMPVWGELSEHINLRLFPYGKARWSKVGDDDFSFLCQHGARECATNQMMCCGIARLRTADRYLPYVNCLMGTFVGEPEQDRCHRQAQLSPVDMNECANGKEGRRMHQQMGNATDQLKPHLFFVPWILVDGKREQAALRNLKTILCDRLRTVGVQPRQCAVPVSQRINI